MSEVIFLASESTLAWFLTDEFLFLSIVYLSSIFGSGTFALYASFILKVEYALTMFGFFIEIIDLKFGLISSNTLSFLREFYFLSFCSSFNLRN